MNSRHVAMIAALLAISWSSVPLAVAQDSCLSRIKKDENGCRESFSWSKTEDCKEAIERIRSACGPNNPWYRQYLDQREELIALIQEKALAESEPAKVELANAVADLNRAKSVVQSHTAALRTLKSEMGQTLFEVKMSSSQAVSDYESHMNSKIAEINSTNDYGALFELKKEVANINFESLERLSNDLAKVNSLRVRLNEEEMALLGDLQGFMQAIEVHKTPINLNTHSEIVDKAVGWLFDLQYQLVDATDKVQALADQKMSILRVHMRQKQVDALTQEQLKDATTMAMRTRYLREVQGLVQEMAKTRKSSYYGLNYLSGKLDAAKKISEVNKLCESANMSSWQDTGCTRAKQYSGNANRVQGTATMNMLRFGSYMFARSSDQNVASMKARLDQEIADGDVDGAVLIYDAILASLEG